MSHKVIKGPDGRYYWHETNFVIAGEVVMAGLTHEHAVAFALGMNIRAESVQVFYNRTTGLMESKREEEKPYGSHQWHYLVTVTEDMAERMKEAFNQTQLSKKLQRIVYLPKEGFKYTEDGSPRIEGEIAIGVLPFDIAMVAVDFLNNNWNELRMVFDKSTPQHFFRIDTSSELKALVFSLITRKITLGSSIEIAPENCIILGMASSVVSEDVISKFNESQENQDATLLAAIKDDSAGKAAIAEITEFKEKWNRKHGLVRLPESQFSEPVLRAVEALLLAKQSANGERDAARDILLSVKAQIEQAGVPVADRMDCAFALAYLVQMLKDKAMRPDAAKELADAKKSNELMSKTLLDYTRILGPYGATAEQVKNFIEGASDAIQQHCRELKSLTEQVGYERGKSDVLSNQLENLTKK